MIRRLIPVAVILVLGAACIGGYILYAKRMQSQTTMEMLQQRYEMIRQNRQALEGQTSQRKALKEQFEMVRAQVQEKIGEKTLAHVEQPICERWEAVAASLSFQTLSCGTKLGRWQEIILVGPTAKKNILYEKLEAELHPVEVRSCFYSTFDESNSKITIIMLDKYNDESPVGQYLHFDPALLDLPSLPSGKAFEELVSKIHDEIGEVRSLIRQANETEQYKRKSALLLYLLTVLDGRHGKRFSLAAMEKEGESVPARSRSKTK